MVTILLQFLVDNETHTQGSLAILMTMRMRRCNAAPIAQQSTTRASRGANGRCHWGITCTVFPRHIRHGHRRRRHNKHNKKELLASN